MMDFKAIDLGNAELKFSGQAGQFEGYAATFGNVDEVGDVILPGAFTETLSARSRPIQMRWNHKGPVIGKWLDIQQDGKGLLVRGELTPGHSVASDVYAGLKHGSLSGMSIGYRIPSGGSEKSGRVRNLKRIDLVEISVVESPANLLAVVSDVKSAIDQCKSLADCETLLREASGMSRADACALVSRIKFLAHGERDAELKAAAELAAMFQLRVD